MHPRKISSSIRYALLAMACCSASTGAYAQAGANITLYGIVDTGVEWLDGLAAGSGSEFMVRIAQGNQYASRLGFRGSEELGGGLKAVFNLESGFAPDTGALLQNGRLFGRVAYVGLQSSWGELSLGRQRHALFELALLYDPLQIATYGLTAFDAHFLQRADNSIKYAAKKGGLSMAWHFSLGRDALAGSPAGSQSEVPGNARIGREASVNLNYAAGKLSLGIGYDQQHGGTAALAAETDKRLVLGASYKLQATRLFAGYVHRKNTIPAIDFKTRLYWLGVNQPLGGKWTVAAAILHSRQADTANRASQLAASLQYDFSRQVQWYVNAAYVNNDGGSAQGVTGATPALPGGNGRGLVTGLVYRF